MGIVLDDGRSRPKRVTRIRGIRLKDGTGRFSRSPIRGGTARGGKPNFSNQKDRLATEAKAAQQKKAEQTQTTQETINIVEKEGNQLRVSPALAKKIERDNQRIERERKEEILRRVARNELELRKRARETDFERSVREQKERGEKGAAFVDKIATKAENIVPLETKSTIDNVGSRVVRKLSRTTVEAPLGTLLAAEQAGEKLTLIGRGLVLDPKATGKELRNANVRASPYIQRTIEGKDPETGQRTVESTVDQALIFTAPLIPATRAARNPVSSATFGIKGLAKSKPRPVAAEPLNLKSVPAPSLRQARLGDPLQLDGIPLAVERTVGKGKKIFRPVRENNGVIETAVDSVSESKVLYQQQFGKGDQIAAAEKTLTAERVAALQKKRFVFDTAGRDPKQARLFNKRLKTESGETVDNIPTTEQVLQAGVLKRNPTKTGQQTVLESFDTELSPKAKNIAGLLSDRRGSLTIGRPQLDKRPRTNPNKLGKFEDFFRPKGEVFGEAKPKTSADIIKTPSETNKIAPTINFNRDNISRTGLNNNLSERSNTEPRLNLSRKNIEKEKIAATNKQIIEPENKFRIKPRNKITPIIDSNTTPKIASRKKEDTKRTNKIIFTPAIKTPKLTTKNPLEDLEEPKPPRRPPRIFGKPRTEPQRKRSSVYDVLIRTRGRFIKANTQPLNKADAIRFGAYKTETTPQATFKITPTTGRAAVFNTNTDLNKFYKKGNLFIEKKEKRINTLGELKGITFKGRQSQTFRRIKL